MVLNLQPLLNAPGERMAFQFTLDLSQVDFGGLFPVQNPVAVSGEVRNEAGLLSLNFEASTVLHSVCDRCLREFDQPKTIHCQYLLADELANDDSDDILLLEHHTLDMDETARTAFILAMDTKTLCSEDCKGICPGCGVNLNEGVCVCKKTIDPRLAPLAKLLEKK